MNTDDSHYQGTHVHEQQQQQQQQATPPQTPPTVALANLSLFGPAQPAIPVFGTRSALDCLSYAIDFQGLYVHIGNLPMRGEVFNFSVQYFERTNEFPPADGTYSIRSIFSLRNNINNVSNEQLSKFGLDRADFETGAVHSIVHLGRPPFANIRIDDMLMILRVAGRYQEMAVRGTNQHGRRFVYQLGVVTTIWNGHEQSFYAQVFPTRHSEVTTHTIFLYRQFAAIQAIPGGYDEQWYPFGDHAFVPPQMVQQPQVERTAEPLQELEHQFAGDEGRLQTDKAGGLRTMENTLRSSESHESFPHSPERRRTAAELANLTFDQILNGAAGYVGHYARIIAKDVILHVARKHTNMEIFLRINAVLRARGLLQIAAANNITRRISVALKIVADRTHRDVKTLRHELNEERRRHGVHFRGRLGGRDGRATTSGVP